MKSGGHLGYDEGAHHTGGVAGHQCSGCCIAKERNTLGSLSEIREQCISKISDLVGGILPKLLPWKLISHQINLIDPNKWINYHLPKCHNCYTLCQATSRPGVQVWVRLGLGWSSGFKWTWLQ